MSLTRPASRARGPAARSATLTTPGSCERGLPIPRFRASAGAGSATWGSALAAGGVPWRPPPGAPRRLPAWWFGHYDHVLRRDQSTGEWFFEALWTAGRDEVLERRFEDLSGRPRGPAPSAPGHCCGGLLPG